MKRGSFSKYAPNWVLDEDIWEKAKKRVDKNKYKDENSYWAIVTTVYKNMGGRIKKKESVKKKSKIIRQIDRIGNYNIISYVNNIIFFGFFKIEFKNDVIIDDELRKIWWDFIEDLFITQEGVIINNGINYEITLRNDIKSLDEVLDKGDYLIDLIGVFEENVDYIEIQDEDIERMSDLIDKEINSVHIKMLNYLSKLDDIIESYGFIN